MITREKVQKLQDLTQVTSKAEAEASELLRIAQDRFNDEEEDVEREGKVSKVKRKTLWYEVFQLGKDCQAAKVLKEHHPEVFEAYAAQEKAAGELQHFIAAELGINSRAMRISDYVKLITDLVYMMQDEFKATVRDIVKEEIDARERVAE